MFLLLALATGVTLRRRVRFVAIPASLVGLAAFGAVAIAQQSEPTSTPKENLPIPARIWTSSNPNVLSPVASKDDDPRRDKASQTDGGAFKATCPGRARIQITSGWEAQRKRVTSKSAPGKIVRRIKAGRTTRVKLAQPAEVEVRVKRARPHDRDAGRRVRRAQAEGALERPRQQGPRAPRPLPRPGGGQVGPQAGRPPAHGPPPLAEPRRGFQGWCSAWRPGLDAGLPSPAPGIPSKVHRRRLCSGAVAACAVAANLAVPTAAGAAEQHAYAAAMNYVTPVVPVGKGDTLIFDNLDHARQARPRLRRGQVQEQADPRRRDGAGRGRREAARGLLPVPLLAAHVDARRRAGQRRGRRRRGRAVGRRPDARRLEHAARQDQRDARPDGPLAAGGSGAARQGRAGVLRQGPLELARRRQARARRVDEAPLLGPAWSFYSRDGDFTGTPVVADGIARRRLEQRPRLRARRRRPASCAGSRSWARTRSTAPWPSAAAACSSRSPSRTSRGSRALDLRQRQAALGAACSTARRTPTSTAARSCGTAPSTSGVSALFGETGDPKVNVRGAVVALDARDRASGAGRPSWSRRSTTAASVWNTPAIDTADRPPVRRHRQRLPRAGGEDDRRDRRARRAHRQDARTTSRRRRTTSGTAPSNAAGGPDYDFGASPNLIEGPDGAEARRRGPEVGHLLGARPRDDEAASGAR